MISPAFLSAASDEVMKLYADLEERIKVDMCRRLAKLGKVTSATEWQAKILRETGALTTDIDKYLASYDKKTQAMVKSLFGTMTRRMITGKLSDNQQQLMAATMGYVTAVTDLTNLTRTSTATTEFLTVANNMYIQAASGAFSYQEALKDAVDTMAAKGLHTLAYGSRAYNIEAMARTVLLTTMGQTAGRQSLANAQDTGTDLVLVTAHEGARHTKNPPNLWSNHDEWQGKVYCISGAREYVDADGNTRFAPNFYDTCGYGEVDGICGINCRHTFYPYYEGEADRYDSEELREYSEKNLELDGKKVSRYEAEQAMRATERQIRGWKRRAACQEAAGIDNTQARYKLGEWQQRRLDICKQTGLEPDYTREYIGTVPGQTQPRGLKPQAAAPSQGGKASPVTTGTPSSFTGSLTPADRKDFDDDFKKISGEAKDILSRYDNAGIDFYSSSHGCYRPSDNRIYLNIAKPDIEATTAGYKTNMTTFLHEYGHWLDYNMLGTGGRITSTLKDFKSILTKDVISYTNKIIAADGLSVKTFARNTEAEKMAFLKVRKDLYVDSNTKSSISDIFEGVTGGKITDGWGHNKSYWKRPEQLQKEAFAEMFEAMASGGQREAMMNQYLPNAYDYFKKELNKIVKAKP